MRALYCQSNQSFIDLLRPIFGHLDSLYWIVDCQMAPISWDFPNSERIFDELHVSVPAFANTSTSLWRPGYLSAVGHMLFFDEWSYFLGFKSDEAGAIARATRLGSMSHTAAFYKTLECEGELLVIHVDGWWEFYFARDELHSQIQAITSWREIALRTGDSIFWAPQFV
jgi:hypothetical protein